MPKLIVTEIFVRVERSWTVLLALFSATYVIPCYFLIVRRELDANKTMVYDQSLYV